jgi:glutaminyl-peptide cyclotransferase
LEFIRGEVFANIWQTDDIIRINPQTGKVVGWIDMRGILPSENENQETDVLNGIAYDPEGDRLFLTGKLWPSLFEVRLIPADKDN